MPPVYVISLDYDHQRRRELVKQLQSAKIDFQLVRATDGKKLSQEQLLSYEKEQEDFYKHHRKPQEMRGRGPLSPAEIGCALSHLKIYQDIIEKKIPSAIILEDDTMLLDKDIKSILANINLVRQKWHVIYLDYLYFSVPSFFDRESGPWGLWRYVDKQRLKNRSRLNPSLNYYYFSTASSKDKYQAPKGLKDRYQAPMKFWSRIPYGANHKLAKFVYKVLGSHAYAISSEGAKCLLSEAYPLHLPADALLTETKEVWSHTFVMIPRPIVLNPELQVSSTVGGVGSRNLKRKRKIRFLDKNFPLLASCARFILNLGRCLKIFFIQLKPVKVKEAPVSISTSQPDVYVISLEQDRERRKLLIEQLTCADISYKLVKAVDGYQLSAAELRRYNRARKEYFKKLSYFLPRSLSHFMEIITRKKFIKNTLAKDLLAGEIGCSLSHLKVYQEIVNRGTPWSIILEDDAQLVTDISPLFDEITQLEQKWDLVLLGYNYSGYPSLIDGRGIPIVLAGRKSMGEDLLMGRIVPVRHYGSQAYAISLNGAKRLLEKAKPIRYQADLLLWGGKEFFLNVRCFSPPIIGISSPKWVGSTIKGRGFFFEEEPWKKAFRQRFGYLYLLVRRSYLLYKRSLILTRQLLRL